MDNKRLNDYYIISVMDEYQNLKESKLVCTLLDDKISDC